jgi:hypothetical protein
MGQIGLMGWPPFPAPKSTDWFPYFTLAATAVGVLDGVRLWPVLLRWSLRIVVLLTLLLLLLRPKLQGDWPVSDSIAWLAVLGTASFALWAALDEFAVGGPGVSVSLALAVLATGTSCVAFFSSSALLALLGASLAATLTATLIVSSWKGTPSLIRTAMPVVVVLLLSLWLTGYFYGDVPAASAVLLALALMAACQADVAIGRQLKSWRATLLPVVVSLLPIALAVFLAWKAALSDQPDPEQLELGAYKGGVFSAIPAAGAWQLFAAG